MESRARTKVGFPTAHEWIGLMVTKRKAIEGVVSLYPGLGVTHAARGYRGRIHENAGE